MSFFALEKTAVVSPGKKRRSSFRSVSSNFCFGNLGQTSYR